MDDLAPIARKLADFAGDDLLRCARRLNARSALRCAGKEAIAGRFAGGIGLWRTPGLPTGGWLLVVNHSNKA